MNKTYVRDQAYGYYFKDEQRKEYGCTSRSTKAQTICSPRITVEAARVKIVSAVLAVLIFYRQAKFHW
jgi:hypothetical protein